MHSQASRNRTCLLTVHPIPLSLESAHLQQIAVLDLPDVFCSTEVGEVRKMWMRVLATFCLFHTELSISHMDATLCSACAWMRVGSTVCAPIISSPHSCRIVDFTMARCACWPRVRALCAPDQWPCVCETFHTTFRYVEVPALI